MTDKADEIARETTAAWLADPQKPLTPLIAAALRSYGKACRDEGLAELIVCAEDYLDPGTQGEGEIWVTRSIIGHAESLKSSSQPIQEKP